ncbi:phosphoadenosine phosphosulfate reductase [Muricomes intestini]|uniref:phosphoadenosine phosphosulfate reductase n=1 Tax=Muricomes intestini TaxID=1796634 RepID=UPI002FDD4853
MEKIYQNKNVYDAFMERLEYVFSEFENIYVSFSGGKDSGLLLNLTLKYMKEHGINKKIGLFHQDFEAQYEKTTRYVTRMFANNIDMIEPFWVCLPMGSKTSLSNYELYWYPWDDEKQDIWVRDMPNMPYIINLENNPFGFYKYKMLQEDLYKQFGRWYKDYKGGGKTIALLGLRADESLHRYSAIVNKRHDYGGKKWITKNFKDVYSASPLYDWATEDVWIANAKFGFDYNKLYDLYYKAGLTIDQMRVASPFNEWATESLNVYRVIEPLTWAKLVGRVQGANFGAIYGGTKAMGYKSVSLPEGHTWKSYTMFLLSTLPEDVRNNYLEKFKTSAEFWKNTGGGFADDVIREIEDCGYKIRRNGISNYTKDKKSKIVFEGDMPDDTDDVKSTIDIPSWKRMCYCILKNDHNCRFMGFGSTKEQQKKIKFMKDKYAKIIRGKAV